MPEAPLPGPTTRLVGLLGDPVEHSASPVIHNAAFRHRGLDACYLAFRVPPRQLADAVRGLAAVGAVGVNVTVPLKEGALNLADRADEEARRTGAANTLVFDGSDVIAHNTDAPGFARAMAAAGVELAGKRLLLVGAGGAARSVGLAALDRGAAGLAVAGRNPRRVQTFLMHFRALGYSELGARPPYDMVVNCTPLGLAPSDPSPFMDWDCLDPGAAVVDLIYNPPETPLLREARRRGFLAVGGAGMLVEQAVLSWVHWFGAPGPAAVMRRALAVWLERPAAAAPHPRAGEGGDR